MGKSVLEPKTDAERQVDDLAMIVRKLVHYVPETVEFRAKALDYLKRHDLMGSPLR